MAMATAIGTIINFLPVDPMRALYWSAVINGVLAAPVMAMLMLLVGSRKVMGELAIRGWLYGLGWASTLAMAVCAAAMLVSMVA